MLVAIGLHVAVALENDGYCATLRQSEQNKAVGFVLDSLSHHIKNILQGINCGNHLIDSGLQQNQLDLIGNGWSIVRKNQQNLANLVMDLLTYGSNSEPREQLVSVGPLVEQVIQTVAGNAADAKVEINFSPTQSSIQTCADPSLLEQAIENVIQFCIHSCQRVPDGSVTVALSQQGRLAVITIQDNGPNLSQDEQKIIFSPLTQLDRVDRQNLAMAVAYKIIAEISGKIAIDTNGSAVGNIFTLRLPITCDGDGK